MNCRLSPFLHHIVVDCNMNLYHFEKFSNCDLYKVHFFVYPSIFSIQLRLDVCQTLMSNSVFLNIFPSPYICIFSIILKIWNFRIRDIIINFSLCSSSRPKCLQGLCWNRTRNLSEVMILSDCLIRTKMEVYLQLYFTLS